MPRRSPNRLMAAVLGLVLACVVLASSAVAAPKPLQLTASDDVELRADLYALGDDDGRNAPFVLLFHQARSNRGEYATIAPRLNELGFNALAIDQRSGGDGWGTTNETVAALGRSTSYLESLPDLEAALAWKKGSGYTGPVVVWGSSYSAALVFVLAAKHEEIAGILSFSPGEYLGSRENEVRTAAAKVYQPVLVLTPEDERARARAVVDAIASDDKQFIVPERAVHGSSMLVEDRNPGAAAVWLVVEEFLKRVH